MHQLEYLRMYVEMMGLFKHLAFSVVVVEQYAILHNEKPADILSCYSAVTEIPHKYYYYHSQLPPATMACIVSATQTLVSSLLFYSLTVHATRLAAICFDSQPCSKLCQWLAHLPSWHCKYQARRNNQHPPFLPPCRLVPKGFFHEQTEMLHFRVPNVKRLQV